MKNKYYKRSHISEAKFRQIMRLFVQDLPASKIADLSGVSRVSINKLLLKIRCHLAHLCEQASAMFNGIASDKFIFTSKSVSLDLTIGTKISMLYFSKSLEKTLSKVI